MKSKRNYIKYLPTSQSKVLSKHVEHSFFISKQTIQGQMIVNKNLFHLLA
jgi:hypothetical protein